MSRVLRDPQGPHWEKRGNASWIACEACTTWFPASPAMLADTAPPAVCPKCHHEFVPAAPGRARGEQR